MPQISFLIIGVPKAMRNASAAAWLMSLCAFQDIYQRLTFKTVAFWEIVSKLYHVNYVVKVDDDSYVRLDRLSIAMSQWTQMGAGADLPSSALMLKGITHYGLLAIWHMPR